MSAPKKPRPAVDDEVKAKFRAALDAKKSHGGADVSDHSEHTKVDHAHGPEATRRSRCSAARAAADRPTTTDAAPPSRGRRGIRAFAGRDSGGPRTRPG